MPPSRGQVIKPGSVFTRLYERTGAAAKAINSLPVPMMLLSTYTALPLLALLGYTLCPRQTQVAKVLSALIGALGGSVLGEFFAKTKKEAARASIFQILAENLKETTAVKELREVVEAARRRFGVVADTPTGDQFEDTVLADAYEGLLSALLDGPEHEAGDLPALQRLKAVLDLDGIVVGNSHRRAAQLLSSRGYSGLEGEAWRIANDKLLFLSERAFSDDEPEEARIYEMKRVLEVLRMESKEAKKEARKRIAKVSRAIYSQYLGDVADEVDAVTGEALAVASKAFGLPTDEAEKMNTETYREIAVKLLSGGALPENGARTLERARGVLQLGDRAGAAAFAAAAAPHLNDVVDSVAAGLTAESVKEGVKVLGDKQKELGLSITTAHMIVAQGLSAKMRSIYDAACRAARNKDQPAALAAMDQVLAFATNAETLLADIRELKTEDNSPDRASDVGKVEAVPMTMGSDQNSGKRLYGIYLQRMVDGTAPEDAPGVKELARVLELSEADELAARIEVCQPQLKELYSGSIKKAQTTGPPLNLAKLGISAEMAKFDLPAESVMEVAMEVYKERLNEVQGRIIKAEEAGSLAAARGFLDLSEDDVRLLHLKAFAKVYSNSLNESMARGGVMSASTVEALTQLRERLGINEEDSEQLFNDVAQDRIKDMFEDVVEAWEEATYDKESLAQLWKQRGKDVGDDVYADGSGELGMNNNPKMEGIRGSKLMDELCKVTNFYLGNKVYKEGKEPEEAYPVTVGKFLEEKTKEEMYGVFAWNTVTCQDSTARVEWDAAKPHVAGILGLSPEAAKKVMNRMVSRWANGFIKQKFQEKGELGSDDVKTLTEWVPTFFGIDDSVCKEIVQGANKSLLQGKVMRLLNSPEVTSADLKNLRDDVEKWDLRLEKDLELSRPQLRSLFRVEVATTIEDPTVTAEQKKDSIAVSRDTYALEESEALKELQDMLFTRCRGCLVNAVGDMMQGNESQALMQMQKLELLAAFCETTDGMELKGNWEVAPAMRKKLVEAYAKGAGTGKGAASEPDVKLLERALQIA